jgi:hypothetical protein
MHLILSIFLALRSVETCKGGHIAKLIRICPPDHFAHRYESLRKHFDKAICIFCSTFASCGFNFFDPILRCTVMRVTLSLRLSWECGRRNFRKSPSYWGEALASKLWCFRSKHFPTGNLPGNLNLRGIVRTSHTMVNEGSYQNLDSFSPAAE